MTHLSSDEERQAQHIACSHLIVGCEGAVSKLQHVAGEIEGQSPTMTRAGDILAEVLPSWRETLGMLATEEEGTS